MTRKIITYLCLFIFLSSAAGCADDDIHYTVVITEIQKNNDAYYCVYRVNRGEVEPLLPKDYFVDECDKYAVGDIVMLSR